MAAKSLNKNLRNASKAKKDEFYTQLVDIEKELKHYKEQFRGKVVYCNCDDPYESNFFKYFASNFNALGLKKIITTSYSGSPIVGGQLPLFQVAGSKGKQPFKIEIKEVPDADKDGAINLDDVKYLLKHDKNTATPLKGSGDFRSDECIGLLKQADIVVTNPPFSGKITGKEQLSLFELYELQQSGQLTEDEEDAEDEAEKPKPKQKRKVNSMKRDILFIERCLRFLKPGGRMAIVLPQGNLNNIGTKALREWIMQKARVLAVVGLGVNTFKPFTGTKTSVLFLQKWGGKAGEPIADYPIFMATSERSGKNNSGDYVTLSDKEGHLIDREGNILDPLKEKPVIDHDLNDIAEAFKDFCNQEGIRFN